MKELHAHRKCKYNAGESFRAGLELLIGKVVEIGSYQARQGPPGAAEERPVLDVSGRPKA
jgi:hypothetical protein